MSFIFMVLHWPEPGHRDALVQSMREMRDALSGLPGCTSVEPPYLTDDGTCLVGISKWESRQAFFASGINPRPPGEIVEGETRLRHCTASSGKTRRSSRAPWRASSTSSSQCPAPPT